MSNKIIYNGHRFYKNEQEWVPSVTSVISLLNKQQIEAWKDKIGRDEADKISKNATARGTLIHEYCENYLRNNIIQDNEYFKNSFINALNKITNIRCLEQQLYSIKFKFAGTVDCIAEFNGKLSIIDFKTSEKLKKKQYLDNYFMQTAAYSIAYEEMTGCKIDNLVIIIGVFNNMSTQIFNENINNICKNTKKTWGDSFRDLLTNFNQEVGFKQDDITIEQQKQDESVGNNVVIDNKEEEQHIHGIHCSHYFSCNIVSIN